jgi:hypothetical protein
LVATRPTRVVSTGPKPLDKSIRFVFRCERDRERSLVPVEKSERLLRVMIVQAVGVSRCDRRELYRYRVFYLAYPKSVESLPSQFKSTLSAARKPTLSADKSIEPAIGESSTPQSEHRV